MTFKGSLLKKTTLMFACSVLLCALLFAAPPRASHAQSDVVETNTEYVLEDDYMGGGLEWEPSQNYKLSDDEWDRLIERVDFMNLGTIRVMTSLYWYVSGFDENDEPIYDFDKRYVLRLLKVLDYAQENGIDVILGEWNEPNTEAQLDYTLGPEKGANDIIRNYDINAADPRWSTAITGFVDYLVNTKGYNCIKYYDFGNEPNLSFSSYENWKTGIQNLHTAFVNEGLTNTVKIVGPDGGFWVDSWLAKTVNDLGTEVELYDLHNYVWRSELEKGVVEKNMKGVKDLIAATYPDRRLFLGEVGMYDGLNIENEQVNVREFWYGVSMANIATQGLRAGLAGSIAWSIDDLVHINGIKPLNDYRVKVWGLWNSKGTEFGIPRDESIRPYYYTWSLLSKYFPKGSSVIYTEDSGIPGVYTAAIKKPNGSNYDLSFVIVNDSDSSNSLTIKVPNATTNPNMDKYVYFENDRPTDSNGFPVPKATLTGVDLAAGYEVDLPSRGVVVLTTMDGGSAVSLNTSYPGLKTPSSFSNLAANQTVTASTEDTTYGNYATNVVDEDFDTVWSPGPHEPAWISVDLGSAQTFNTVEAIWRDQFAESFKVQVSDDGTTWTDVYETNEGQGTFDVVQFPEVTKRYVRIDVSAGSAPYVVTLKELKVYNDTTASPSAHPAPTSYSNLALNKTANASSGSPGAAFDGLSTTYWTSSAAYPQWIDVDLGSNQTVNKVKIKWFEGAKSFRVQTSTNGTDWTDRFVTNNGKDGYGDIGSKIDNLYFPAVTARYVRVYMSEPNNFNSYSILEVQAFNDTSGAAATAWDTSGKPLDTPLKYVDQLSDWTKSYSHTANLGFDGSYHKKVFEYDNSRIKRTTNTAESVVYKINNFKNAEVKVYGYNGVDDKIRMYTSPDNVTWSEVRVKHDVVVEMADGWYRTEYAIDGTAPVGSQYLKVEMYNDAAVWSPQIGSVSAIYDADFIDDMNDLYKVHSRSASISLDPSNASAMDGDVGKIMRTGSDTAQSVVYRMSTEIADFNTLVYGYSGVDNKVKFYVSADADDWTEVDVYRDTAVNMGRAWYKANFKPTYAIPAGMNYLKVEMYNDAAIWSPQVGQVSINRSDTLHSVDDLNDLQRTTSSTANWALDGSNAQSVFEGDYSRIKRTANLDESVVYKSKNDLTSFKAKVYGYGSVDGKVKFYTSPDDSTWTEISAAHDTAVDVGSGWYRAYFTPAEVVPAGTKYLKIEFGNDANVYSPQLSQVNLTSLQSLEDDAADWSTSYANTSGWALDGDNAGYFEGDKTRFKRTSDTAQSIVYRTLYDMTEFSAKIFAVNTVDDKVAFYASPDGDSWASITSTHDTPVATGNGWYRANFGPSTALPVGTRYLKVEFSDDALVYSPQLSGISIPYKYKYLGKTVSLKSVDNGKYVTTDTLEPGNPLEATSASAGTTQQFVVEDAGEGYIALRSVANGKYVSVSASGASPLQAIADTIGTREKFWVTDAGSGKYALHAIVNDMFVSVDTSDPDKPMLASSKGIESTATFEIDE